MTAVYASVLAMMAIGTGVGASVMAMGASVTATHALGTVVRSFVPGWSFLVRRSALL